MEHRFIAKDALPSKHVFQSHWQAPSNIALVKYWGKSFPQLPKNASLSFTLSHAVTQTEVLFTPLEKPTQHVSFSFFFEGKEKLSFRPKLEAFFSHVLPYQPFLSHYFLEIKSKNTFPHSSGIASSASSMAALAACLVDLENSLFDLRDEERLTKMSFLARLGSGSASRSIQGPMMAWGSHPNIPNSSDLFAVSMADVHPVFSDFCDTILLIDKGQKQVSSTLGHNLMINHPYASQRFDQAQAHLAALIPVLAQGDLDAFIPIVEKEALHLHAMMMTSDPYFILMQPNTLLAIERIWEYRKETGTPVCFTLDAGANVHLLYPHQFKSQVESFVRDNLLSLCQEQQGVFDQVGTGLKKL